ncbi:MAG TPA: gamma-glutamyltransferase family protein [Stellaceae bacterium]|nr:gamma-glutamyltransferase family protein [Stellaceae bacterium]
MFTTRPEIRGTFGAVSSTHWLASAAGMGILERGGNAFDAAVAVGFVLQVVEPHLNGPGGEVPILLWSQKNGRIEAVCGQGVAPAAATPEYFHALGLDLVPGTGLLPACVPGAFGAWMRILRDYGTMRPEDVLAPAIHYAGGGYPLVARIPAAIQSVRSMFESEWPSSAAVYLSNGGPPVTGQLFRNPWIARTYGGIIDAAKAAGSDREAQIEAARRAWYEGFVAEAIDRFYRTSEVLDTSGRRHQGLLTGDDMARWRASVEAPITYDYQGYTVAKCGPWTQGPLFLQQLSLLKRFDIASMDPLGPEFAHTVVECAKLAFADREAWYGDPNFVDVPIAGLLSDSYADARRDLVTGRASMELRPGAVDGRPPRLARAITHRGMAAVAGPPGIGSPSGRLGVGEPTAARMGVGEPTVASERDRRATAGDTCHVDVIDRWGNMIAATPSGGWLQSSPVIPELGFGITTRGQMFWIEEGLPASLAPGKRPRTTLTPSFVLRQGEPYMAFGTPGGDQQEQWQMAFFLRHVVHRMNLQEAIDVPSFHTEHMPSSFWPREAKPGVVVMEGRTAPATVAGMKARGHSVQVGEEWSEGRLCACAVERTSEGTIIKAGANPRGMQGYAVGR